MRKTKLFKLAFALAAMAFVVWGLSQLNAAAQDLGQSRNDTIETIVHGDWEGQFK